jgi:hypothetical protein
MGTSTDRADRLSGSQQPVFLKMGQLLSQPKISGKPFLLKFQKKMIVCILASFCFPALRRVLTAKPGISPGNGKPDCPDRSGHVTVLPPSLQKNARQLKVG